MDPLFEQLEAYAGWLVINPVFQTELTRLRSTWAEAVARRRGIPLYSVSRNLEFGEALPGPDCDRDLMAADFIAFYQRWHLITLPTWDLPQPVGFNLGAPAAAERFLGITDGAALQLPPTVRLPARCPVRDLVQTAPEEHLAEWKMVLAQQHPSHFSFARWRRIFHLHFFRNVVLTRSYPDRLHRRAEALDWVFADYFDDEGDESVRKQRQWLERRVQEYASSSSAASKRQ
jgi:hypothetical protein